MTPTTRKPASRSATKAASVTNTTVVAPGGAASKRRAVASRAKVAANADAVRRMKEAEQNVDAAVAAATKPAKREQFNNEAIVAAQQQRDLATWEKAGRQGDRPGTSVLDAIRAKAVKPGATKKAAAKKASPPKIARAAASDFVFTHDGVPMRDTLNTLVDVAWRFTAGIDPSRPKRIGTRTLRALLSDAGIAEPESTEWSFKLPNGITLGAIKRSASEQAVEVAV